MASHSNAEHEEHREENMVTYTVVIILLMVLLAVTYWAYTLNLGAWNLPVAMIIAVVKASLVLMVFMHVRLSPKIVWVFSIASFFWLVLMIAGFENDYIARPWDGNYSHNFLTPEAAAMVHAQ
jgi:cytochrome c oxidase subunit IV